MSDEILNEEQVEPVEIEEEARLKAIQEHEALLNSFPDTTVFYERIIENDTYKVLAGTTRNPYTAELNKCLDNHMDTSELSVVLENGIEKYYLKGYEKPEPTEEEKMLAYEKKIEADIDNYLFELVSSRGYDDVKSCVGYYNSTDETFQREARAISKHRDQLYRKGYDLIAKCEKGEIDYRIIDLQYILNLIDPLDW